MNKRLFSRPSHLALAGSLLALAPLGSAWAQSATHGATLYSQALVSGQSSCSASACHSSNPANGINRLSRGANAYTLRSSFNNVGQMHFLNGQLTDADINDLSAYIAQATGQTATYIPTSTAPAITLGRSSFAFGSVQMGQSAVLTGSLTNSGSAALTLNAISSNAARFGVTHDCPTSLAVGSACTLTVTYTPTSAVASSGTLTISSDAASSPNTLALSGTGVAVATPNLAWANGATRLTLANTTVGATSAVQTLTLQNTGTGAAQLSTVSLTGTDAAQFSLGGSCAAGASVAAADSCTVTVSFSPASTGAKSASVQVTSANANSPAAVALAGTGVAATDPGTSGNANAGGAGCTIAPGHTLLDPLWALMLALSAGVLGWRARQRAQAAAAQLRASARAGTSPSTGAPL